MSRTAALAGVVAVLLLTGCTPLSPTPHLVGAVKIAADLPLSGDDAPDGLPVEAAINMALDRSRTVCGATAHPDACVSLSGAMLDDVNKGVHDPATGAANLAQMTTDARIVGVIGPLYDSLARSEIPVANAAGLALISPSNTDECLTQEPADGHCHGAAARLRPHGPNNYFRVVTTQLVEGQAAADLAVTMLGRRHAVVIDDQTPFGQAVASEFISRFHHDGGTVLDAADLASARSLGADVVYVAGTNVAAAAALRRQMGSSMSDVPMIGTDRLSSNQFALAAGIDARGCYYTLAASYPPALNGDTGFLRDYRNRTGQDAGASAVAAFDATNLLIRAIARAIDDAGGAVPTRQQVRREVAATMNFQGLMGSMSIDAHGDTTLKLVAAYQWLAPTDRSGRFTAQLSIH